MAPGRCSCCCGFLFCCFCCCFVAGVRDTEAAPVPTPPTFERVTEEGSFGTWLDCCCLGFFGTLGRFGKGFGCPPGCCCLVFCPLVPEGTGVRVVAPLPRLYELPPAFLLGPAAVMVTAPWVVLAAPPPPEEEVATGPADLTALFEVMC